jgi:hypothetical protein
MSLEVSDAVFRCEEKLRAPMGGEVRKVITMMVARYELVLEGSLSIDEAREWYVRASDAYEGFRLRGDNVSKYQGALQHTYVYCEERMKELLDQ